MPDTLKAQYTAFLTAGRVLYSDMGRMLCFDRRRTPAAGTTRSAGFGDAAASRAALRRGQLPGRCATTSTATRATTSSSSSASTVSASATSAPNVNFFVKVAVGRRRRARPGSPGNSRPGALVDAALRDEHAGGAVEHAAPARSGADLRAAAPSRSTIGRAAAGARRRSLPPVAARERARLRAHRGVLPPGDAVTAIALHRKHARSGEGASSTRSCRPGAASRTRSRRGQIFRIVDLEGNQAVDTLFYNAHDPDERYSARDTIRAQGNIYLTTGTRADVERGPRAADHRRRHLRPPRHARRRLLGESNQVRYALDKKYMHSCRDNFLLALAQLRPRHEQARPRQQHQLLHERAGHARRRAVPSPTASPRPAATSRCAPRWTCWC